MIRGHFRSYSLSSCLEIDLPADLFPNISADIR